jgi:hypothetical protein
MAAFFCARALASSCRGGRGAGRRHSKRKRLGQCLHTCTHTFLHRVSTLPDTPSISLSPAAQVLLGGGHVKNTFDYENTLCISPAAQDPPWRRQSFSYTCDCMYTHQRVIHAHTWSSGSSLAAALARPTFSTHTSNSVAARMLRAPASYTHTTHNTRLCVHNYVNVHVCINCPNCGSCTAASGEGSL